MGNPAAQGHPQQYVQSPSPSAKDRSRQGSLSPPPELSQVNREAFFGSSFAAFHGTGGQVAGHANPAIASGGGAGAASMRKNTFALSSINRMQGQNKNSNQEY